MDRAASTTTRADLSAAAEAVAKRRRPRPDRADVLFLGLCAATAVALLLLSRHLTFWWDEWAWIWNRSDWSLDGLMAPYNQHWLLGHLLIYQVLLTVVGLTTYVPYMAVLIAFHLLGAWFLYRLVRRSVGPLMAIALGAMMLLYGNGHQDLLWPANIMFVAATAIGLAALGLVLGHARPQHAGSVVLLCLLLVTFGGAGLLYVGTVIVALMTTRARRSRWWLPVPALVLWGVWYLLWGREQANRLRLDPDTIVSIAQAVWTGATAAAGNALGGPAWLGVVILAVLATLSIWACWRRRRVPDLLLVGIAGFVATFAMVGLVRADAEVLQSRHQYLALVFLLLIVAALVRELLDARAPRRWLTVGVWALAMVSVLMNARVLVDQRPWYLARGDDVRAWAALLLRYGGSPAFPDDREPGGGSDDLALRTAGTPRLVRETFARFGSLERDAVWGERPIPDAILDGVLFRLVRDQMIVTPLDALPPGATAPELRQSGDAVVTPDGGCLLVQPDGELPTLTVAVPGGSALLLGTPGGGTTRIHAGLKGAFANRFQMNWTWADGFIDVPIGTEGLAAVPSRNSTAGTPGWCASTPPSRCRAPSASRPDEAS